MEIIKFFVAALILVLVIFLGFRLVQSKEVNSGSFSAPTRDQRPSQDEVSP